MTKLELALELAKTNIESMEYDEIVALATARITEKLLKLPKYELEDQYEYVFGTTE
jgi:hypothetical protein